MATDTTEPQQIGPDDEVWYAEGPLQLCVNGDQIDTSKPNRLEIKGPRPGEWDATCGTPATAKDNQLRTTPAGMWVPDTGLAYHWGVSRIPCNDVVVPPEKSVFVGARRLTIRNPSACRQMIVQGMQATEVHMWLDPQQPAGAETHYAAQSRYTLTGSVSEDGSEVELRDLRYHEGDWFVLNVQEMNHHLRFRIDPGESATLSVTEAGCVNYGGFGSFVSPRLRFVRLDFDLRSMFVPIDADWPGPDTWEEDPDPLTPQHAMTDTETKNRRLPSTYTPSGSQGPQ